MKNIDLSILHISNVIERSLNDTICFCQEISSSMKYELSNSPFIIDLLDDALRSERLKETAHSRILYRILHNDTMRIRFVEHFLPDVSFSPSNIQIPYPDRHRIDLTIKSDTFFLIIENKINNAPEQPHQIEKYFKIAQKLYPDDQIYVMYLGGDANISPSEQSLSTIIRQRLCDRLIIKNYKDDITTWCKSVYEQVNFNEQPFLKSTLLLYITYLENKYNINKMNNKIDKALIETLRLNALTLTEKIKVIEDQIDNIDKIRDRLSYLLDDYYEQSNINDIKEWYTQCSNILLHKIHLTMENNIEFGFNFKYHNLYFRCTVSYEDNQSPYWGIYGLNENNNSRPKIFGSLRRLVLNSNKGFHNYDDNSPEWVISNYEKKEMIVDKFVDLANLIYCTDTCYITE